MRFVLFLNFIPLLYQCKLIEPRGKDSYAISSEIREFDTPLTPPEDLAEIFSTQWFPKQRIILQLDDIDAPSPSAKYVRWSIIHSEKDQTIVDMGIISFFSGSISKTLFDISDTINQLNDQDRLHLTTGRLALRFNYDTPFDKERAFRVQASLYIRDMTSTDLGSAPAHFETKLIVSESFAQTWADTSQPRLVLAINDLNRPEAATKSVALSMVSDRPAQEPINLGSIAFFGDTPTLNTTLDITDMFPTNPSSLLTSQNWAIHGRFDPNPRQLEDIRAKVKVQLNINATP